MYLLCVIYFFTLFFGGARRKQTNIYFVSPIGITMLCGAIIKCRVHTLSTKVCALLSLLEKGSSLKSFSFPASPTFGKDSITTRFLWITNSWICVIVCTHLLSGCVSEFSNLHWNFSFSVKNFSEAGLEEKAGGGSWCVQF